MKVIKVLFVGLFIGIFIMIIYAFVISPLVLNNKIKKEDYEEYLLDKYGDLGFEYVSTGSCNYFETGSCTYYFTTPELNGKTFSVIGNTRKSFEDDYLEIKDTITDNGN